MQKNGAAYITKTQFNYTKAVWGLRLGMSTYSSKPDAYAAAEDDGNGLTPRPHGKHEYDKYGKLKKGVYFDHYHVYRANQMAHIFYGAPNV